ncbi:hypothetical protein PIB30_047653 [Stylosanthes scabra]|uniref:Protein LURP-one-related 15 n=1 Tax=Stylosanthes scabra TaxID=79078 RepID=A0ABU6VF65_9FABA|nr:hypothetical protein [Stylosanthes scabra]
MYLDKPHIVPILPPSVSSTGTAVYAVVGPQFCATYTVYVTLVRHVVTLSDTCFNVTDDNGNLVFYVKSNVVSLHDRIVIKDPPGNTIITLRRKTMTLRDRWQCFRGDSVKDKDLIFNVRRTFFVQHVAKLDVFLAHNTAEKVCDYKVKGSFLERSATIYVGETDIIVATMKKHHTAGSILIGKDNFTISVSSNFDYCFAVAIIMILYELNRDD